METTLEVLPVGGRGRRNRKWPDEVKAWIVAETLWPGITVNAVARRYGDPANYVSAWRTLARKGRPRKISIDSTASRAAIPRFGQSARLLHGVRTDPTGQTVSS